MQIYYIDLDAFKPNAFKDLGDKYVMDEFDKTMTLLHDSTDDKDIRESLLIVHDFKLKTLKNEK